MNVKTDEMGSFELHATNDRTIYLWDVTENPEEDEYVVHEKLRFDVSDTGIAIYESNYENGVKYWEFITATSFNHPKTTYEDVEATLKDVLTYAGELTPEQSVTLSEPIFFMANSEYHNYLENGQAMSIAEEEESMTLIGTVEK